MSDFPSTSEQLAVFKRGAVDLIDERELTERIERSRQSKTPLKVKFGMDPSSADLHVGHAVCLRKLRAIQDLGHTVILIVGDATAMVGDPSGRNKLRPQLTREQVEDNLKQVFGDSEITGKFHLNFMDAEVDKDWSKKIHGETASPGVFIIRSGTYGQDGMVMDRLKHSSSAEEIKTAMTAANEKFASLEDRKTYSEHVRSGRRNGIYFENEMSNAEASDRRKGRRNGNRRGGRNR